MIYNFNELWNNVLEHNGADSDWKMLSRDSRTRDGSS